MCTGPNSLRTRVFVGLLGYGTIAFAACSGEKSVSGVIEATSALTATQTISFQDGTDGYNGTTDTRLSQNAASTSYGAATSLSADGDDPSGSGKDTSVLVRWDLTAIPAGSVIESASITLRITDASSNTYPVLAMLRSWSESSATWQQAQAGTSWQTAGALGAADRDTTTLASITGSATGTLNVNLNAAGLAKVSEWVNTPSSNFGFIIASSSNTNGLDIASSKHATVSYRPLLAVTFTSSSGGSGGAGGPVDAASSGTGGSGGSNSGGSSSGGSSSGGSSSGGSSSGGSSSGGSSSGDSSSGGSSSGGSSSGGSSSGGSSSGGSSSGGSGSGGRPDAAVDVAPSPGSGGTSSSGGASGTGGNAASAVTLFAAGDVGDCNETADTATGLLLDGSTDPIALLGDIGYPNGTAADLANCFDPVWGRHKSRIRPSPGNHEYLSTNAAPYFSYFGAAAGDPTKGYYSYEHGAWHIIVINSNCGKVSCSAGSAQEQWLRADLAAHPTTCTLAYWHHPLFNSGHHGGSSNMKPIWQALMDHNADVVLNGHEHGYQRWKPMNPAGSAVSNGITEFIAGTGGTTLAAFSNSKPANNAIRDASTPGVLKLTLRATSFDWQFVPIAGKTFTDQGSANCH